MCFEIHPDYPEALIAKRDILCYKVLNQNKLRDDISSPFQLDPYFSKSSQDITVTKTVKKIQRFDSAIYEGLHTFSNYLRTWEWSRDTFGVYFAIIPKGTKYYYNSNKKEYVSEKLIVYRKKSFYLKEKLFNLFKIN